MGNEKFTRINCCVDSGLSRQMEETLSGMGIDDYLVQGGKQVCIEERRGFLGFGRSESLSGAAARLYRFRVPRDCEESMVEYLASSIDLYLPGRGFLYGQDITFDDAHVPSEKTARSLGAGAAAAGTGRMEHYELLTCIVHRGMADALLRAVLELGLCVPFVTYGKGVGLRNKLGLLRVTIPVEKEIVMLLVPERDAALAANLASHTIRLDRPGQGFIYRQSVRMYASNLRVRLGKRVHAASMEQVINALDDLRGSSEWRRFSPSTAKQKVSRALGEKSAYRCLSLVTEDGSINDFVKKAMDCGAGGATLMTLSSSVPVEGPGGGQLSAARESCDLIIRSDLENLIRTTLVEQGITGDAVLGRMECEDVLDVMMYRGKNNGRSPV